MHCHNCGADLPINCKVCPVCEKEIIKQNSSRIPRLLLGGSVVLLVCLCTVLSFLLQNRTETPYKENSTLSSFLLIDPDDETTIQASSFSIENGSYGLTGTDGSFLGTYSVITKEKTAILQQDQTELCSIWDEAADGDQLYSTIRFADGCGIVFSKGNISSAVFGKLDENAYIADVYGIFIRGEDGRIVYLPDSGHTSDPFAADENEKETAIVGNVIITTEEQQSVAETSDTEKLTPAQTVYITDSGEKFHRADCSYLNESAHAIDRTQAEEEGYTACSRCQP